jgi:catechol 2,3-dioxygenase-like lactoylglutathione lyase family enzyme
MPSAPDLLSAISLFVDDLAVAKRFYLAVFGGRVVHEDASSVAIRWQNLILNLLHQDHAAEIVAPLTVGAARADVRCQFSVRVPDVQAAYEGLRALGVAALQGPIDRPWGLRTVSFADPSGHSWELGQALPPV